MACIDRTTWNAAVAACNAQSSVKGLGIWVGRRRPRSMSGLGILGEASTLDVSPGVDPCAIAAQTPCVDMTRPPALKAAPKRIVVTDNLVPTPPPAATTKSAGYMKVGLLAVVVVVGGVVAYKTLHKKKAS